MIIFKQIEPEIRRGEAQSQAPRRGELFLEGSLMQENVTEKFQRIIANLTIAKTYFLMPENVRNRNIPTHQS